MGDVLLESLEDGLLTLTLNRPERRNALDEQLSFRLLEALERAATDQGVRAVLIRGSGKYFCVGGDVKSMAASDRTANAAERQVSLRRRMEASRLLHQMPKPTVAAINGAAAGAGLALALACDLRIAAESAKFTTAFAKVGLSGDYGGSYFLTRAVGDAKARELYLTSPLLNAAQARELHLVSQVVPDADLEVASEQLARGLARGPTVTLGLIKMNLNAATSGSLEAALDLEAAHHVQSSLTRDHQEAAAAFVEKREPIFHGA
jgi:2-(1,2-epoxy-1,2-dihydrophenyl)acetyl-CoA isomerase